MKKRKLVQNTLLTLSLVFSLLSTHAQAGRLDDLESASSKKSRSTSNSSSSSNSYRYSSSSDSDEHHSIGDAIVGALAEAMVQIIVEVGSQAISTGVATMAYAGKSSLQRYQRNKPLETDPLDFKYIKQQSLAGQISEEEYDAYLEQDYENSLYRSNGDPILPTVRIASQWLSSNGKDGEEDINAQLYRIEAGYGLFGFSATQNNLQEGSDNLSLTNLMFHYRMSFGNDFSWDLAFGNGKMNGNQSRNGSVFSMPMRYRFNQDWHFEYYPVWTDYKSGSLAEHQFSFNYHYKHLGATLGYKTWSAGSTSVNGLFTGLYLSF